MGLVLDSELRGLLLDGKIEEFNQLAGETPPDLRNLDLRSVDLKGADLTHANLEGAYLRNADLRGADLRYANLDGASLHGARIGGVLFPRDLSADEIQLSLREGTRLRAGPRPSSD